MAKVSERKHLANAFALFFAGFLYVWSVWQHEIMLKTVITSDAVGQTFLDWVWGHKFNFFTGITTPWGASYDVTLLIPAVCVLMIFLAVWYWE